MENLTERTRRIINTRDNALMPNEVFTFVTHNNVKLDAVCVKRIGHTYIDESDITDNILLCYSQNRLFKLHEIYNSESKEYRIHDFNQPLVDYCIIPEYDKMLE